MGIISVSYCRKSWFHQLTITTELQSHTPGRVSHEQDEGNQMIKG